MDRLEMVIAGKITDPLQGDAIVASGVIVANADGQRRAGWALPHLGGAPLHSDSPPSQAPALADLNGDGTLEIVVALFDGTIRALRENGTLLWQYDYAQGHRLFASEPAIGDVSGDGVVDIVFGTYSPDGSAHDRAGIMALSAAGQPLSGFPLPLTHEGSQVARGVRAAPTLADLDRDGDVEILAASQAGTVYGWDLPAPYRADKMPWPNARGGLQRDGSAPAEQPPVPPGPAATAPVRLWVPVVRR